MTTAPTSKPVRKAAAPATKRPAARRPAAKPVAPAVTTPRRGHKARNLVIVESPTKARTVGNILGDDYLVIASVGHVRDLPPYGYGVENIEQLDFTPKYVIVKDKKRGVDKSSIINEIAAAAKDAERVFLSTDPDREGEAIAWHIREAAGIPEAKTARVVFHEITKPAIERAFEEAMNPAAGDEHSRHGKLDQDLVDAQQARRVLDRLIGFPLTWFVQKKVSRGASAGRVQSVALGLIVKREREITDFRATEYWSIHAKLARANREFEAELIRFPSMAKGASFKPPFKDAGPAIANEAVANELAGQLSRSDFRVTTVKKGEKSRSPVPSFTTSTFQQAANNRLNMGASRAMSIAQELYEGIAGQPGLITYMRTDSLNVSPEARRVARAYIGERWGKDYVPAKERVYSTRTKGAQEAHEAIRPTDPSRAPESFRGTLNADQMRVYTLIWQRFVASQMTDARYSTVSLEIEAREGATVRGIFRSGAQHLIFAGHLAVYGADASDTEPEEDAEGSLPDVAEGEPVDRRNVDSRQHHTEPPPRYTEASLVKALEEQGIGRPSTYASIVQTVQKRDYVTKQGRALVPQKLGFLVHDLLDEHMKKYVAVPFTGDMELELDKVADGERDYASVLREFWPDFKKSLDEAEGNAGKHQEETNVRCNVCDQANLVIKWGRNGEFFACPRYPECSNSLPMDENRQPVFVAAPTETKYACPKCGHATVQKSGPYGPYIDCTQRETKKCDFRSGVPAGVACPEEPETGQLVEKTTKRGVFYGCWNYPHCSYTANTLEPAKMPPARPQAEREAANLKLLERSVRGKAAFAKRKTTVRKAS